jgi:hypothetical protein
MSDTPMFMTAAVEILGLFILCGCSTGGPKEAARSQAELGAPTNAAPAAVQAALDANFQTWSAQGMLGVKIPDTGYQDLAAGASGRLTVADQGEAVVKSDIMIGSYRLAAGTVLKKSGTWWTIFNPPTGGPADSNIPRESTFEGYLSTGLHLASGEEIIQFLDPASRPIPAEDATKASASSLLGSIAANVSELSTSLEACLYFASQAAPIEGKPAQDMIHIAVFPVNGGRIPNNRLITGRVVTARLAGKSSLVVVTSRFGEPTETQTWKGKTTEALGLDGTVRWWGNTGVIVNEGGAITHVLLRGRPKG